MPIPETPARRRHRTVGLLDDCVCVSWVVGGGRGANSLSLFVCPRAELDKERLRSTGSLDLDGQPLHQFTAPPQAAPLHASGAFD